MYETIHWHRAGHITPQFIQDTHLRLRKRERQLRHISFPHAVCNKCDSHAPFAIQPLHFCHHKIAQRILEFQPAPRGGDRLLIQRKMDAAQRLIKRHQLISNADLFGKRLIDLSLFRFERLLHRIPDDALCQSAA